MFTLIFHPVADADLYDNYWWYEDKEVGLGERFEGAVLGSLEKVCFHPQHYTYSLNGYRRILVPGFPYVVTFEVDENDETVYVVSIYHTSRGIEGRFRERND